MDAGGRIIEDSIWNETFCPLAGLFVGQEEREIVAEVHLGTEMPPEITELALKSSHE
jgi:hypothetical protein